MGRPHFVMETGDKCFICLKAAPSIKIEPVGEEGGDGDAQQDTPPRPPPAILSVHNIFQYVKVDVSDILPPAEGGADSSKNDSSCPTLEGRLCSGCGQLSQQFSSYFQELVAIRMKLDSCLKSIYDKMVGVTPGSEEDAVVDELRRRAVEGCSRKLSIVSPQVKVEKLSADEVPILPVDLDVKVESDPEMAMVTPDTPKPELIDVGPTTLVVPTPMNKLEETEDSSDSGTAPPKQSKLTSDPPKETFILPDIGPDPDPAQDKDHPSARDSPQEEGEPGIEENHNCKFCPRQFFSRNGLARHLALAHFSKIATKGVDADKELSTGYRAYTTVYSSHSQAEVEQLLEDIHPDPLTGIYTCPGGGCKLEFEGRTKGYDFRNHYKAEHLNVSYKCKLCSKRFPRIKSCHQHYREHHMAIRYSCNDCGIRFSKDELSRHLWKGSCFT